MSNIAQKILGANDMDFEIIQPGPGRLIRALIDEIKIIPTINGSPGTRNNGVYPPVN